MNEEVLKLIKSHNEALSAYVSTQSEALAKAIPHLIKLPVELLPLASINSWSLSFCSVTHEQKLQIMRALALGRWKREPNWQNTGFDYTHTQPGGYDVTISMDGTPPNCTIVEVEVEVPAQPATTRKVKKLVCGTHEAGDEAFVEPETAEPKEEEAILF